MIHSSELGSAMGHFGLSLALSKAGSSAEDRVAVLTDGKVAAQVKSDSYRDSIGGPDGFSSLFGFENYLFGVQYLLSEALKSRKFAKNRPNTWELALKSPEIFGPNLPLMIADLRILADGGGSSEQFNYAMALKMGIGCTQDSDASARYLRLSADQGYVDACLAFAFSGPRLWISEEVFDAYLERAVLGGNVLAILPLMDSSRWRASEGGEAAMGVTKRLADEGDSAAQVLIGSLWKIDRGEPTPEELRYLKKSARQGNPVGQYMYARAREGSDRIESLYWMRAAAGQGFPSAVEELPDLERRCIINRQLPHNYLPSITVIADMQLLDWPPINYGVGWIDSPPP
jgi:TPR repeat protein